MTLSLIEFTSLSQMIKINKIMTKILNRVSIPYNCFLIEIKEYKLSNNYTRI